MEEKLKIIFRNLSTIKKVSDIRLYSDHILFCYGGFYFFVTNLEGYGNLDNYAHIVLANALKIENEHIEIGKDVCIQTMIEFDNVRLFIENDCTIVIHTQVDYNDTRLYKEIKSCLKDMIAAKDFFMDKYIMITTFADSGS